MVRLLFAAIPSLEPPQQKLEASVLRVAWIGALAAMAGMQLMIANLSVGWEIGASFLYVLLGLKFASLGNVRHRLAVFPVARLGAALIPIVYSYLLWCRARS